MKRILFSLLLLPIAAFAELEVPNIFSDHMILQQNQEIQVWGKGDVGATISVSFKDQSQATKVDGSGMWNVLLAPESATFDPGTLRISDGKIQLSFDDVLVGEVWLCSGQSNMSMQVWKSKDADIEMAMANHPAIRLYTVQKETAGRPKFSSDTVWKVCTPETVGEFSAVGYFFGRDLQNVANVPVGLINASWGGTPAIAWTRESAFNQHPLLIEKNDEWKGYVDTYDERLVAWEEEMKIWLEDKNLTLFVQDPGISEEAKTWHQIAVNDFSWDEISLPAVFEDEIVEMDGSIWFRKRLDLPAPMRGQELTLALGPIADFDKTWVNGVLVGETGEGLEQPHTIDRRYTIPAQLTRTGELTIAIRVFDRVASGGFLGEAKSLLIVGGSSAVSLGGKGWVYKIENKLEASVSEWQLQSQYPDAPSRPQKPNSPHRPASLANGMLATVAPYNMRGAVWYQGESDAGWEPEQYGDRLKVMIEDWRTWWNNDSFQFGVVQLAGFKDFDANPMTESSWAILRESQRTLVRDLPHSGLVVATDLGEANDIHPLNKQDVGRRLARWALTDVYGLMTLRGGPEISRARFLQDRVVLTFAQMGETLMSIGSKKLGGFIVAGDDGTFVNATARIDGNNKVVITSDEVSPIRQLRYGWKDNPEDATLGNKARLPASPFEVKLPPR